MFLDKVPCKTGSEARDLAEQALGRSLDEVFESFEEDPLGAASIGQVHAAKTKDGEDVVVKVRGRL